MDNLLYFSQSVCSSFCFLQETIRRFSSDTFSKPVSGSSEPQQSGGWFKVFTVAAYQPYFDIDTSDVLERIKDSLLPFGGSFNEKTASNPDL